jgi:hypothetical protein
LVPRPILEQPSNLPSFSVPVTWCAGIPTPNPTFVASPQHGLDCPAIRLSQPGQGAPGRFALPGCSRHPRRATAVPPRPNQAPWPGTHKHAMDFCSVKSSSCPVPRTAARRCARVFQNWPNRAANLRHIRCYFDTINGYPVTVAQRRVISSPLRVCEPPRPTTPAPTCPSWIRGHGIRVAVISQPFLVRAYVTGPTASLIQPPRSLRCETGTSG